MAVHYFNALNARPEDHPEHEAIVGDYDKLVGGMNSVDSKKQFRTYDPETLKRLTAVGHSIGLDRKTILDMLFIGSRKKKFRDAETLIAQMVNWQFDMKERQCPYRFESKEKFAQFSGSLLGKLEESGLPCDNVCVMGSSLRSTAAKDLDLCILLSPEQYALQVIGKFSHEQKIIMKSAEPIVVQGMSYVDLLGLCSQIDEDPEAFNANAKIFMTFMRAGLIRAEWLEDKTLEMVEKFIREAYPDQNIEQICFGLAGGPFALSPALRLKLDDVK